jgi:hypothetical protein
MTLDLFNRLLYLDRDFITGAYEAITGKAPVSQITKNEGMKANAQIPLFSAGISATESRSFNVSTLGMLNELLPKLQEFGQLNPNEFDLGLPSKTGWVDGLLRIFRVDVKQQGKNLKEAVPESSNIVSFYETIKASETYFAIRNKSGLKVALVTTPSYFVSGLDALIRLNGTVVEEVEIPVKALIRVFAAQSSFNEWLATPFIILEP